MQLSSVTNKLFGEARLFLVGVDLFHFFLSNMCIADTSKDIDSIDCKELLVEAGALSSVIEGMQNHKDSLSVQISGCTALNSLTCASTRTSDPSSSANSVSRKCLAVQLGAMQTVAHAMTAFSLELGLQKCGCQVLLSLFARADELVLDHKEIAGRVL